MGYIVDENIIGAPKVIVNYKYIICQQNLNSILKQKKYLRKCEVGHTLLLGKCANS